MEQCPGNRQQQKGCNHSTEQQMQSDNAKRAEHLTHLVYVMPVQRQKDGVNDNGKKCADAEKETGEKNADRCGDQM